MGQIRHLSCLFSLFTQCKEKYSINLTMIDKSVNGVLGTWTWGGRIEGPDESADLCSYYTLVSPHWPLLITHIFLCHVTISLYVFSRFLLVLSLYLPSSPLPYFFLCHWQLAFYILRLFLSFSLCIFWNTISLSGFTLDRPTRNFVCYLIKVFVWKQKLYSCCCCWCCSAQWRWCWWLWCCLCHHFYNPPLPP